MALSTYGLFVFAKKKLQYISVPAKTKPYTCSVGLVEV